VEILWFGKIKLFLIRKTRSEGKWILISIFYIYLFENDIVTHNS
jgi:hypothetical protein